MELLINFGVCISALSTLILLIFPRNHLVLAVCCLLRLIVQLLIQNLPIFVLKTIP